MPNPHFAAAPKADGWSLVERRLESGPAMLRFRTPVLDPSQVEGYGRALRILWPYAVLTFDGARQWILLDAFDDPDWSYLREKLLGPASGAE
jgi:hypothetical protein